MPKTSFFVSLSTPQTFGAAEYPEQASLMANVFTSIFADSEKMRVLTKKVPLTCCHTEVEVSQQSGLIGRAVVDLESTVRVGLDKTKLSQMLKSSAAWSEMKVEKRLVPIETLEQAGHVVTEEAVVA
jgi:hypothetical protein